MLFLGRDGAVIFIPPHLAEKVVKTSEIVRLRDMFGHQRIREKENIQQGKSIINGQMILKRIFSKWFE